MGGRIRTIKPEWLDDERMSDCSSEARVLSIGLLLMADDVGRGRLGKNAALRVFPKHPEVFDAALQELRPWYVVVYEVRGQLYFEVVNWKKHQRIDRPSKPLTPDPSEGQRLDLIAQDALDYKLPERIAYFIRGHLTGLIKIGESVDPVRRLGDLGKDSSEALDLLAIGGREAQYHARFKAFRVHGEWFKPCEEIFSEIRALGGDPEKPIVTVHPGSRAFVEPSANSTVQPSRAIDEPSSRQTAQVPKIRSASDTREPSANARDRSGSGVDLDPDQDLERKGVDLTRARERPPPPFDRVKAEFYHGSNGHRAYAIKVGLTAVDYERVLEECRQKVADAHDLEWWGRTLTKFIDTAASNGASGENNRSRPGPVSSGGPSTAKAPGGSGADGDEGGGLHPLDAAALARTERNFSGGGSS